MSAAADETCWHYDGSPSGLCGLAGRAWKLQSAPGLLSGEGRRPFDLAFFSPELRRQWGYLPRRLESMALRVWMSEAPLEMALLRLAAKAGLRGPPALADWSDPDFRVIAAAVRSVSREEHRLKGFARFSEDPELGLVAVLTPDFDVVPALVPWFEARLGREPFALVDARRGYAIVCPAERGGARRLIVAPDSRGGAARSAGSAPGDAHAELWQRYFSAAENPVRANPKLQGRLVPRRYRPNMPEFDAGTEATLL